MSGHSALYVLDEGLLAIEDEQEQVVGILSPPAKITGHPKVEIASRAPDSIGLTAAARLRGTAVTLAAAGRSSFGTLLMT